MNADVSERTDQVEVIAKGQHKEYTIIVNGREREWTEKEISFDQVVILAFGSISTDPNVIYTVTYNRGEGNKPDGTMVKGDAVTVKNGMVFNATPTNRS